jgi:hypothetical protein
MSSVSNRELVGIAFREEELRKKAEELKKQAIENIKTMLAT